VSIARAERLVNLVLCLLSTRQYLSAERIRDIVPGYADAPSDEAFFRMFERDKAELRDLGIPLEVGRNSVFDPVEGYRIARRDYELGDVELEPDEAAAVALAVRLWDSPELTSAAQGALIKLRAAGVEVDHAAPAAVEPRVRTTEPAFASLLAAVQSGRVVMFDYRTPTSPDARRRTVEPWGVVSWRGRWYVVGHDRDRGATRCFRLSRILGEVATTGRSGVVQPPEGVDLLRIVAGSGDPHLPAAVAQLWVAAGRAQGLRRSAKQVRASVHDGLEGEVVEVELRYPDSAASWIAGYGPDVVVLEPDTLRKAVRERLLGVVEQGQRRRGHVEAPFGGSGGAADVGEPPDHGPLAGTPEPDKRRRGGGVSPVADRLPRLLALVPYLLARPGVLITEAAADFGVAPRQLRRDLELLWMCGLPGYGPGDLIDLSFEGETVTVTYDAGMRRPLRLTAAEATSLLVALRALAETPGVSDTEAVQRALAKIEMAVGRARPAGVVVGLGGSEAEASAPVRDAVSTALQLQRALHIRYYTASRDEVTERTVDPMRLLLVDGRGYLEAWCRSAGSVRLFRMDRIDEARVLDEATAPPPHAEPTDISGGLFRPQPGQRTAVLELERDARWIAEYYAVDEVVELGEGRARVRMRYADARWMRRLLLSLGGEVWVEEPAELADAVRSYAAAAVARSDHLVG
jgi:proteasome accessory factor B